MPQLASICNISALALFTIYYFKFKNIDLILSDYLTISTESEIFYIKLNISKYNDIPYKKLSVR
jgi:hypothetical protein